MGLHLCCVRIIRGVERCRAVSSGVERCRAVSRCRVWHLDTDERGTSLDGVEGCRVGRVGMGCRGVESVSRFGVEVSRPGLRSGIGAAVAAGAARRERRERREARRGGHREEKKNKLSPRDGHGRCSLGLPVFFLFLLHHAWAMPMGGSHHTATLTGFERLCERLCDCNTGGAKIGIYNR